MPRMIPAHQGRRENVGVDSREGTIGTVEPSDVVPEAGEGEPDRIRPCLEHHFSVNADGRVERDVLGEGHLDFPLVQDQALLEDLLAVRGAEVVDPDDGG